MPGVGYIIGIFLKRWVYSGAGTANFFLQKTRYVRLCEPRGKLRILCIHITTQNVTSLSSDTIQNQASGWIWPQAEVFWPLV